MDRPIWDKCGRLPMPREDVVWPEDVEREAIAADVKSFSGVEVSPAQTVVTMNSGNTVVIGGLIRDDKTHVENKVPLIGDVPVVGNLFRWQRDRVEKTNLLIFITPHVMTSEEQLQEITDRKREQMLPLLEAGR